MRVTVDSTGLERVSGLLSRLHAAMGDPLLERIGEVVREQTDRRFDTKRGPSGAAWKAWSPSYAATRPAHASLLIDTEALRRSIEDVVAGERVEIRARTPYAGAVQGPRPYLGLGDPDTRELARAIERHVQEVFLAA